MGTVREIDAISDAIIETEREIAGEAWGQEDTARADETGDRSLEAIGDGLEGQHEAEDDEEAEGETEGDEDSEAEGEEADGEEGEGEAEGDKPGANPVKAGEGERKPAPGETQSQGRVPPGKLREANEARRAVEAERDDLRKQLEAAKVAPGDNRGEIAELKAQVATLTQLLSGNRLQQPPKTEQAVPPKAPDIFENPDGFVDHLLGTVRSALSEAEANRQRERVEEAMANAHATHGAAFEEAFAALNGLNPANPDDRVVVQRIYKAPNAGVALMDWHKRNKTLARVGNDPEAYEARIREETKASLLKDPEFRKQLVAELRGEAATGENGGPRTTTRLPKSLARAGGSNLGAERIDTRASDDSEQSVADAAWR